MHNTTNKLFLGLVLVLSVSAAALVLSLPAIFGPHEDHEAWLALILGGVTAASAAAVILMRPPRRHVKN